MPLHLNLHTTLSYQVNGSSELFFKLALPATSHQHVLRETLTVTGARNRHEYADSLGNRILRLSADGGPLTLEHQATLIVKHHFTPAGDIREMLVSDLPDAVTPYLLPSRYCQSDQLINFAQQEFGALPPGYERIVKVCQWVRGHIQFVTGITGWNTSALEVLTSRRGICRDYAHLAIAFLRALNIPARFVSGYDYGADPRYGPPDFHAYVEAYAGGRWYLEDVTGLCPRVNLIRIATGRDAADCAFATMFGPVQYKSMKIALHPPAVHGADQAESALEDVEGVAISTTDEDVLPCPGGVSTASPITGPAGRQAVSAPPHLLPSKPSACIAARTAGLAAIRST